MPSWEISIESYGRLLHRFCDALGIGDCVARRQLDGRLHRRRGRVGRARSGSRSWCWSPPPGSPRARLRRQPGRDGGADGDGRCAAAPAAPGARHAAPAGPLRDLRGLFQHPELLRRELLLEQFHNGAGRPGFLPAVQGLVGYDILDRLDEVEVPTLIVWGRNDRVVPPQDAVGYGRRLRNSRTVIFDDTGHLPQLERPVRFNRVLETFLAE